MALFEILSGASAVTSLFGGLMGASGASAGAGIQARGIQAKAQAESDALRYNSMLDEYSAQISDRDRLVALDQAAADGRDVRRKSAAERGMIRAAYGWSGLALEGSPLDVIEATAIEQELDFRKTLYTGEVVAAGLSDKATMARAHASMLRQQAEATLTAGTIASQAAYTSGGYQSAASLISGVTGALSAGRAFFR